MEFESHHTQTGPHLMDAFSSLDFQQIRPNRLLDGGMSQLGVRQELVYRNQQKAYWHGLDGLLSI